jgi:hypothetical protein
LDYQPYSLNERGSPPYTFSIADIFFLRRTRPKVPG